MNCLFSVLPEKETVLIEVSGRLNSADIASMRRRTVELQQQTNFRRYIMDVRRLEKIEEGSTFEVHEIGERFSDIGFSALNKTAVIMPQNPEARRQIEFLHTVEINRGRGAMKYVQSIDEAFTWLGTTPNNH